MLIRPHAMQVVWVLAAAMLLAAAGLLQHTLDRQSQQYEINPPEVTENYPAKALLTMAPGGLRAPVVSYLWIRAGKLQEKGRHYEAMQLADLICKLQPNFAGVWGFHAYNMAWNISVTTHTPEERWLWVYNGVKLLRDAGIPQNRKSLQLYKELGWIFYFKMGHYMDDMHMAYKQRWASQMQRLLACPPYGATAEAIGAFRPIAEAPLDKDPRRQGKETIQADQLAEVLRDPAAASYAGLLKANGVQIDEGLLAAYNRYGLDEAAEAVRLRPPQLDTDADKAVSDLVNSARYSEPRSKLLAFVRAQLLWNVYRMDPEWMLQLMEKHGPLDWRMVQAHGLYWTTYGLKICQAKELADITSLNTDRLVLGCLKYMTWNGRLTYLENPYDPDSPVLTWASDLRFIEPTQREFVLMGQALSEAKGTSFAQSDLAIGHVNYLAEAIEMLYAGYRRQQAQELLDWLKKTYNPDGPEWSMPLEDFVVFRLNLGGQPTPEVAYGQISCALQAAFTQLAAGDTDGYRESVAHARRVYDAYQKDVPARMSLPEFAIPMRDTVSYLLAKPSIVGVSMSLLTRADLYARLDDQMQRMVYDLVEDQLRRQCQQAGLDFAKSFPAPPGLDEYRSQRAAPGG